jgi:hypothetical protein
MGECMMEILSVINPVLLLLGVFLIGFIPAKIAEGKDRSFALFYVLGSFFFIPTVIVAVCIGNKYDDERASGRGIKLLIPVAITVMLTPKFAKWFDELSIPIIEKMGGQLTDGQILVAGLGVILLAVLLAFFVGLLVMWALKRPISFIVQQLNRRNESTDLNKYSGHPNRDVLIRLDQAIPLLKH